MSHLERMTESANCDLPKRARPYTILSKLRLTPSPTSTLSALQSTYYRASVKLVSGILMWVVEPNRAPPGGVVWVEELWEQLALMRTAAPIAKALAADGICSPYWEYVEFNVKTVAALGGIKRVLVYLDVLARDHQNDMAHRVYESPDEPSPTQLDWLS